MKQLTGLKKAAYMEETDRFYRACELREEGKHVFLYMCGFVPLEMLTALDIVPVRLLGDPQEPQTEADKHVENIMCSFCRSCFDLDLKGRYDFADGIIVPHSCDNVCHIWNIWTYFKSRPFEYFMNMPHVVCEAGEYLLDEFIAHFRKKLEEFAGQELTDEKLSAAISIHNRLRQKLRNLYELRKEQYPRISGKEIRQVLIAVMSLPVAEGIELVEQVIDEVKSRPVVQDDRPRIMVYGPAMDTTFVDLVEECGANVVIDDACTGTRYFATDVDGSLPPAKGLAKHYFNDSRCPRTYKRPPDEDSAPGESYDYDADMKLRFGYMVDYAREFSVDGVILYVIRYCDSHGFDMPDIRDYLKKSGFPVLPLEGDYAPSKGQLLTRIQAFLEMIDE